MDQRHTDLTASFLADRHGLMAYIQALVQRTDVAEDVFQEVWLRVADAAKRNIPITDPARWCRGVAKNVVLHHWRSEKRARVIVDSELLHLVDRAFAEQDPYAEELELRRHGLRACVGELPEHAKEVLRLKYVVDLTAEEVGARVQRTTASVLMLLSRLRRSLEECVDRRVRSHEGRA